MSAGSTVENSENAPAGPAVVSTQTGGSPPASQSRSSPSTSADGASGLTQQLVFDRTFVTNLEHELRTPIGAAIGFLEIISDLISHGDPDDELKEFLERASRNCDKMLQRVDQIICYADLLSDRQEILLAPTNVSDILERSRAMWESSAFQKGLEFKFATLHTGGVVLSNTGRLAQILNIIVHNAFKFTSNGSINITTSDYICGTSKQVFLDISVSDTGIGLDALDHGDIFLPFKQIDSGTSRKFSGLGLGLAIAKRTADLIGVMIHVESRKREGSRFTIRVPASPTTASM